MVLLVAGVIVVAAATIVGLALSMFWNHPEILFNEPEDWGK
jgi:hypothetical protein